MEETINVLVYDTLISRDDWRRIDCDVGICTGNLDDAPAYGDRLRLRGKWAKFRGEDQFKFSEVIDADIEAIENLIISQFNVSSRVARLAAKEWKKSAVSVISKNPYDLMKLSRVGFEYVDSNFKESAGIADDDERRVDAAIISAISGLTSNGDTSINTSKLKSKTWKLLGFGDMWIVDMAVDSADGRLIIVDQKASRVAAKSDYENDSSIWEYVDNG